ncbi:cupin domain-containing protein [Methylobacterium sp. J-070]|uniref:cupin domain-containing protein n=1 Tax=Methylobacterium sp. J-070 TaxID=2836650 RepID=UPI001FB897B9|nr:cupin domain-containing protein [Methylobacterium sp. J-070]MCJ2052861.1 cupin domain-containing protein [Methylobacterium sp. J-070]
MVDSDPEPAPAIKRIELSRSPVTASDHLEIITQLVEFRPGATSPRHFHHGEETFFVLEGGTVQEPGRPPRERVPGENGIIPRGAHHSGYTVIGDRTITVFSVYVVEKGKPLQELVA